MDVTLVDRKLIAQRLKAVAGFGKTPDDLLSRREAVDEFGKAPDKLLHCLLNEAGNTMTAREFAELLVRTIQTLDTHWAVKGILFRMIDDIVDALLVGASERVHAKREFKKLPW